MHGGDEEEGGRESTRRRHTLHVRLRRWLAQEAVSLRLQIEVMRHTEAYLLHYTLQFACSVIINA